MLSLDRGPRKRDDEDMGGEQEDDGVNGKGVMKAMHMNNDQSERA
jgi:hypothetical protein